MERLFKAKKKTSGEWVEGYIAKAKWYLDEKEMFVILPTDLCIYPHCEFSEWIEVDKNTICQFTGLTDKNGCKIWENDIVYIPYMSLEDSYCKVVFRRGAFIGEMADGCEDSLLNRKAEVISNIFDNPELLQEDKR